jgi:ABC-type multidrug transport system fused ATPase/permease subunit
MTPTPISPGAVLDRALQLFRQHFAVLFPLALVIALFEAIVTYALEDTSAAAVGLGISLVAATFLQGIVAGLVRDVEGGGGDRDAGQLLREVAPVLDRLLIVSVLAGVGAAIGMVFLIAPGLFLLTIWAVAAPVVVVERTGIAGAFTRSRELVRGNGWQVLGLLLLVLLLVVVVAFVAALITEGTTDGVGRFAQVLLGALVSPVSALATAVLYFELRRAHGEPAPPVVTGRDATTV